MTKNYEHSAVLLLSYERPQNTIEQVKKLAKLGCRIYLFVDGPKTEAVRNKQNYLHAELSKLVLPSSSKIQIRQEKENLNLTVAIPKAIDWVFSYEENAVIFEDDIDFHEDFLNFSQNVLAQFARNDDVLLVTGNQFMVNKDLSGLSITSYPLIWGWSTTSRKWEIMKALAQKNYLEGQVLLKPHVAAYWKLGWMRWRDKKINSWIIGIAAQMRFAGKYCIAPKINLTSNIGDDKVAAHTTSSSPGMRQPIGSLDWKMEDYSSINLNAQVYDQYLEKNLYNIGMRHLCTCILYEFLRNLGIRR